MTFAPLRCPLKHAQPWMPALALCALAAMIGFGQPWAQPARVFFKDSLHPVVSGEVWLVANRWGAYPGVLVATIQDGKLEIRPSVRFPQYWEQAFDYKVLVAVSDQPAGPPASLAEDYAYGTVGSPEYLKRFSTIYLSPPLASKEPGSDWPAALERTGRLTAIGLVLPPPVERTIRLLYPDGRPLVNVQVPVRLFGSDENHCGHAAGVELGIFTTNGEGKLSVMATSAPLVISETYYDVKADGPAGKAFSIRDQLIVGGEPAITVKKLWTLPTHDYAVRLRTGDNKPIAHAHLTACLNFDGCGAGCGQLGPEESGAAGTIRFRERDLREMRSITAVKADGTERALIDSEMRQLLTTYNLTVRWD